MNISQLIHSFKNEQSAVIFIKAFFKTIQKEWHGIDQLRMDKFYLLIRFLLKETFNFLKKYTWNERLMTEVNNVFQEEPLNPNSLAVPDGIRLHLVEIFLTELESVVDNQMSSDVFLKVLDPLFFLLAHSRSANITSAVNKNLFERLIQGEEDNQDKKKNIVASKLDFGAVAERLFSLGTDKNILGRNRRQLFGWSKRLRKCAKGEHKESQKPVEEEELLNGLPVEATENDETSDGAMSVGECNGSSEQSEASRRKCKKRKKKELEAQTEVGNHLSDDSKKHIKKRKKSKKDDGLSFGEDEAVDVAKVEQKKKKKKSKHLGDDEGNDKTVISKKQKLDQVDTVEESSMVNGCHKTDSETQVTETEAETNGLPVNGEDIKNIRTVKEATESLSENEDCGLVEFENRAKAFGSENEPFARFQSSLTTPPAFFRKCASKAAKSEPRRLKKKDVKDEAPGSEPAKQANKRVRIAMSKNTAHTPQDYQRSLKESPRIPFDAKKAPTQGLLKSPPKPQRTPLHFKKRSTLPSKSGKKKTNAPKRSSAVDFF